MSLTATLGDFTSWISLLLRPQTETKWFNFGLSPELRLTNQHSANHCSLQNVVADVIADISVFLLLIYELAKGDFRSSKLNLC